MDTFHESSEVDGDPPESSDNGNQNLGDGENLLNKNDSESSFVDKEKMDAEQLLTKNNNAETLLTQNEIINEQIPEEEAHEESNEKNSEIREDSNVQKGDVTTNSSDLASVSNEPDLGSINGNNGLLELANSQDTASLLNTVNTENTEPKLSNEVNIKEEMTIGETQVEDHEDTSNMVLKSLSDFTNLTGTDNLDNARIVDKASLQDVSNIINSQMGTINVNGTDGIEKATVLDYASVMSDNNVISYSAGDGEVGVGIDGVQYVMADDGSATAVVGAHGSEDAEALLHKLVSETLPPASSSSNTTTTIQGNIMVTTSNNISQDFHQQQQDNQQGTYQNLGQAQQILTQELVQALPQALTQAATLVNTNLNLAGGNTGGPTKIVIQTNQANSPQKVAQPLLIQVGGSGGVVAPVISAPMQLQQQLQQQQQQQQQSIGPGMVMTGGKSHFVIRSGQNSLEQQQQEQSPTQGNNIFKIIVPEGTTKYTKPISPVKSNEPVRKHIQINLSDGSLRNSGANRFNRTAQGRSGDYDRDVEEIPGGDSKRYYECATCHSRFMRPLYLRKHMRSCKKVEVKQEKTPLYMCSFCKMTFKTKPQINQHFLRCYHSPYAKKTQGIKRKGEEEEDLPQSKKGRMASADIDPALEQAVQFRCQDCDRTFSKERQYSSHIKRCTKISVHDLTGARTDLATGEEEEEEELDTAEDPFADPRPSPPRRGRGGGRRGRPPGRGTNPTLTNARKTNYLFDGSPPTPSTSGLLVADNEGLVRSTTGLAHTVLLSLETASQEGNPQPMALVADSKGVRGRPQAPQAWSLVCALCQKMFITKQALATHVMTEHGPDLVHMRSTLDGTLNSTKPLYRCPVCSLAFEEEEQFLEHLVLQHTAKLQETFSKMQGQSATFVCSLCSLVLLTRNLLMEHLSLIHLDELESLAQGDDTHIDINSSHAQINNSQAATRIMQTPGGQVMVKQESSSSSNVGSELVDALECGFCGDHLPTQEAMMEHYVSAHGVETDEEGALLDLGLDVDIRVKDTKSLLQLADGQADETLPEKTVLIRKKPRQSWQCKECQQVFSKHFDFLRHVREVCPDAGLSSRGSLTRGNNFKCQQPGCSHLSFYQFKTLVKHMEEIHKVIIPREVKTFKNLTLFYQWLSGEEKKYNVRYIRDTTRIEKNDMKLIQMVCHRFHTAKNDSLREAKEEMEAAEGESPAKAKRRWFVRIQRSGNCHARIHLKVSYNPHSVDYDGETQMVYYPQHTHTDGDHPPELMDRIMDRHNNHRDKGIARNKNEINKTKRLLDGLTTQGIEEGDSSDQLLDMSGQTMNMVLADPTGNGEGQQVIITTGSDGIKMERELTMDQCMAEFCQTQLENEGADGSGGSTAMVVTTSGADGTTTSTILQPARASAGVVVEGVAQGSSSTLPPGTVFMGGGGGTSGGPGGGGMQLVESAGEPGTYVVQDGAMVMNVAQAEADKDQGADTEEYVLPADESEWTKLFDVLRLRLVTTELSEQEKSEGEGLLPYQNVISYLPLTEQVTIFQQLCMLTNTAIETAD